MTAGTDVSESILIASDSSANAALVKKLLDEEFPKIATSSSPDQAAEDFRRARPDVLVLAFNGLEKSQLYYLGLYRLGSEIQQRPHRTIILCNKDEVRQAYKLCREGLFDDYVLFWPMTHDAPRLPMAVHHAVRELAAQRSDGPTVKQFAAQAHRIAELGALLEQRMQHDDENARSTARAVVQAGQDSGSAVQAFLQRLIGGALQGAVDVKDIGQLERELGALGREAFELPLEELAGAVRPLVAQADEFRTACAPHLDSVRALEALAQRVQPLVLVVDDDEFQRKLVGKTLGSQNYALAFAASGIEALNILRGVRPDLILLDVMMPEMDGLEVARQIKASTALADIPLIMLTGKGEKSTVKDSLALGAVGFILKPFVREQLIEKVARVLTAGAPPAAQ